MSGSCRCWIYGKHVQMSVKRRDQFLVGYQTVTGAFGSVAAGCGAFGVDGSVKQKR